MSKNTRNRILLTALAALLLVTLTIGGTMAWLVAETQKIENVFTTSNVGIELAETAREYEMVPGNTLPKDPHVTVATGSEDCWVFVEIVENNNVASYITYSVAEGWMKLDGETGKNGGQIYYYKDTLTAGTTKYILSGNNDGTVKVKEDVTAAMMKTAETNKPTLTFYAYACQSANVENAATAWTYIENGGLTNPPATEDSGETT